MKRTRPCMRVLLSLVLLAAVAAVGSAAAGDDHHGQATRLTWYGQSAFRIVTPQGHVLLIDPWITNPANPHGKDDLAGLDKADLILVTHGHFDHVGDAVAIARRTGAQLVANSDLGSAMVADLGYPEKQAPMATLGNSGGTVTALAGDVSVTFEPAVHGSTVSTHAEGGERVNAAGSPGGFVIRIKNGPTFYHTGDTAAFSDMQLIPEFDHIDVMLACIGDHFTMGPKGAALAVQFVKPDVVVPMHYGTFPALSGTPDALKAAMKQRGLSTRVDVMKPGQTRAFK